jgi:Na+-transporting NADH:ubiquinone oxidoreductase subunit C
VERDDLLFYYDESDAVAFEFHGPGLWGLISGVIGMENDRNTIRNIKIVHQEETPGLGGRIAESEYLQQFRSKRIYPKLIFVPEGSAELQNQVDAITGATGTSKAFEKLLNETFEVYLKDL